MRNGGAAGFSITSQPVLSSGYGAIGEALGEIGNTIANFDPFEDKLREVQYRTMQAQLEGLQLDNSAARTRMFDVPAVSGRRVVGSGPVLGQRSAGALGQPGVPEVGELTVTNPWRDHVVDPNVMDAAAFEQRYGDSEMAQMGYGLYVGQADFRANYGGYIDRAMKAADWTLRNLPPPPLPEWLLYGTNPKRPRLKRRVQLNQK